MQLDGQSQHAGTNRAGAPGHLTVDRRCSASVLCTTTLAKRHASAAENTGYPTTLRPIWVIRTADRIESDNGRWYRDLVRYQRRSVDDLAGQVTPMSR
jgi:hypothetical protein